jgi:predicted DNA-binding protein YlxM (UPF0122 family)
MREGGVKENEAGWIYVYDWVNKHIGLLKSLFKKYGWYTGYDYEDFEHEVLILGLGLYEKLKSNDKLEEKAFYDDIVWNIRTLCWNNRTIKRKKDIGGVNKKVSKETEGEEKFKGESNNSDDGNSRVKILNIDEMLDFYNPEQDTGANKVSNYNILNNLLSYLTVQEAEYLTMYLGIGDAPSAKMDEIAARLHVTKSAVSQGIKAAKAKLYNVLNNAGITADSKQFDILERISKLFASESDMLSYSYNVDDIRYTAADRIKVCEPFRSICTISEQLVFSIASNIKARGYDISQPLIVWKEEGVLIDGHTRLEALKLAEYDKRIPVVNISLPGMREAVDYALNIHYNRRKIKEADILRMSENIFSIFHTVKGEREKTMLLSRICADLPIAKLKKIVTLMEKGDESEITELKQEKISINEMYKNLKNRRFTVKR